jgi:regulator of sirC expression with transglutaminase-like and TPR domain
MQVPIPERLLALLDTEDARTGLAETALLVAHTAYRDLDVRAFLDGVNVLAEQLRSRLVPEATVQDKLSELNQLLYGDLRFGPDPDNYYDPRNSFLNDVLTRRRGIPITLSVLYIELGRSVGLDLDGVAFPGHFLVRCEVDGGMVIIDAYHHGKSLSLDDLRERLQQSQGAELPDEHLLPLLEPARPRDIVLRMLRNLKGIYLEARRHGEALTVVDWLVALDPESAPDLRDRGLVYEALECSRAALADYEAYMRRAPDADDIDKIRGRAHEMRAAAARLN